jgi:tetratricopeptide (TPR) repeat protein
LDPTEGKPAINPELPGDARGRGTAQLVGIRRRLLFRLAAMFLVPLLFVGATEAVLRLTGYGYATTFFKGVRIANEDYLVENDKFGWRYFPPEISRSPSPVRFHAHKPPGMYRIFLLGESAALGDPEPAFGMGRYLQALLRERYPETQFEVVPAAMTAINSHAVLPIARECAGYEGDLWIIYMGNNEMIGPFGAITIFGSQSPPLWYIRLNLALQKTRLGQLLVSAGRHITGSSGQHGLSWGGMQMFLNNQIAPDDPRKEKVYSCFQRNLEDILQTGRAAGVPMILSTVAVNLKDCAPFGSLLSLHPAPAADMADFDKFKMEAMQAQARGDLTEAARKFEQASKSDPHYAELQFHWGQCLVGLTNFPAALAHFEQARDGDALPFRTDSRMNAIIAQARARFAGPNLSWFDAVDLAISNSPAGIPGDESFYEHVHFNFDGNYRMALALAEQVRTFLPQRVTDHATGAWSSQTTCEDDLCLTDWNRRDVYENVKRRFGQAPFTGQPGNAERITAWSKQIEELRHQLTKEKVEPARNTYVNAIRRWPEDFRLHWNYAEFLDATSDRAAAVAEWKIVQSLIPQHHVAYFQIGRLLAQLGQTDEARRSLLKALALRPDLSEGWYELGRIQDAGAQYDAALQSFERALKLVPEEPRYHYELGRTLGHLFRDADSIAELRKAARLGPGAWEAHYVLGEHLAFANQVGEARHEFEETIRLNPSYAMAHLNLGVALVKQGHLGEAQNQFEEVLRLEPANVTAKNALAQLSAPHHKQ